MSGARLTDLSLCEIAELIRTKKVSPIEVTKACLEAIEQLNPKLNAFITVTADLALAGARIAEAEIARGNYRSPLHGVPIALKDIIDTAGVRTTAASALFAERVPQRDGEVVRRLKSAGAVSLGKTNLHEFAYGGSSAISQFGPVHNPWKPDRSSGGSSGGSAAAVAARLCYGAIGTDTGGSIRQPAAYCGIVGLKPTYGRVSVAGVIPLSRSLDHVGPMTRTVKDASLMLNALAGYDGNDPVAIDLPVPDFRAGLTESTSSLRLGIPRDYFYDDLHPDIAAAIEQALGVLKGLTTSQCDIPPLAPEPSYSSWAAIYSAIFTSEAYAFHRENVANRPGLYQPATLKRLRVGAGASQTEYDQARLELDRIRQSVSGIFNDVDLFVTPTVRVPPTSIDELSGDMDIARAHELAMLHNTRILNLTGLPTISVPCGFTSDGLPIGLQITGRRDDEAAVLRLAHAYEQRTEWHKLAPR